MSFAPDDEDISLDPDEQLVDPLSEEAMAIQFATSFRDLRYVKAWGWMWFDGQRWRRDDLHIGYRRAREITRRVSNQLSLSNASSTTIRKIASASTSKNIERLAMVDRRIATPVDIWDADPWLLNTPGGTVDLRTGSMMPHDPKNYITRVTSVSPGGQCPTWDGFLLKVMAGKADMVSYLQRVCGYLLTGVTSEHAMFFAFGTGSNGKSVFTRTLAGILADYHATAATSTFTEAKFEQHATELAGLAGARAVTAVETEEGKRWNETRLKTLTGGDPIKARFMRQDEFTFQPQLKLIIVGNHKPSLRSVDEAWQRRMNIIPFTVTIPKEERDLNLPEKLRAEWPGILAWMIEGCREWQRIGLAPPKTVRDATADYVTDEDAVGLWIEECCILDPNASQPTSALFASWQMWAERRGEFVGTMKGLSQKLTDRGFQKKKTNGMMVFAGIRHNRDYKAPMLSD